MTKNIPDYKPIWKFFAVIEVTLFVGTAAACGSGPPPTFNLTQAIDAVKSAGIECQIDHVNQAYGNDYYTCDYSHLLFLWNSHETAISTLSAAPSASPDEPLYVVFGNAALTAPDRSDAEALNRKLSKYKPVILPR